MPNQDEWIIPSKFRVLKNADSRDSKNSNY